MSFQQLILVGNVGRDPELRYTNTGTAVTDFSVAVSRFTGKDASGKSQEITTWYKVTCWNREAEIAAEFVKKGRQVMIVSGRIEASHYVGKDGQTRTSLDVTADRVVLLANREGGAAGNMGGGGYDAASGGYPAENDFSPPRNPGDIPF
ncbi:MAG: single-stranded DNA-binding protein [Phototrophicaceae bacterium]|jgi:single-strand DNA-binding protein